MKKAIFYFAAILAISFTSCSKEYSCQCEVEHKESATGYSYSYKFDQSTTISSKEDKASSACSGLDYSKSETDQSGIKQEIIQKCTLK